ncbi:MAG: chromate resistance protein [Deltaproteobacteria bacterium]|nr:chromate resistance protein [Deltaproteobacteria bacterium]
MSDPRWLLLIHQIPPKPGYLRVKAWRQLQRLGAVSVKNSIYVLPRSDDAHEDLQWILREITAAGGDGSICEARFIDGLADDQLEAMFHAARDADYADLASSATRLSDDGDDRARFEQGVARLRRRLEEIVAIDFFGAPGRDTADRLLGALEAKLCPAPPAETTTAEQRRAEVRGSTWITRKGIHVDRMASAWLIRCFIDPDARFQFVDAKRYRHEPGELRFDMFEAEYTHEGDRCSFEVLVERFGLDDVSLIPLAEIVHDIDLKDGKFGRPETGGIASLVAGIAMAHAEDESRLARASAVFDDLREYFRRKPNTTRRGTLARDGKEPT